LPRDEHVVIDLGALVGGIVELAAVSEVLPVPPRDQVSPAAALARIYAVDDKKDLSCSSSRDDAVVGLRFEAQSFKPVGRALHRD